jgi:phosphoribosylglycinamide formyltransferase-1
MKKNIIVLISGRGSNLKSIINATKDKNYPASISLVISDNKNALGLKIAQDNNINTLIIERNAFNNIHSFEKNLIEKITFHNPYLICLAGFMRMLSNEFVDQFRGKIINIHPSLLPRYKGLNTHEKAINAGDEYAGCTVHYVTEQLDSGEIISQQKVKIEESDNINTLSKKVLKVEHKIYPEAIKLLLS